VNCLIDWGHAWFVVVVVGAALLALAIGVAAAWLGDAAARRRQG